MRARTWYIIVKKNEMPDSLDEAGPEGEFEMTKNDIAQNINAVKDLARTITTNWEMDFAEGNLYDNRGKAESWADRDNVKASFIPETTGSITYVLFCDKVPCHAVDYSNKEECDSLGATDCWGEAECLVPASTKMMITYVSCEDDFKEMGYYVVEMELVEE